MKTETLEEKTARLMEEKALLVKGFNEPGFQLLMLLLKDTAKAVQVDYAKCRVDTEEGRAMFNEIKALQYVCLTLIPKFIDERINVDMPRDDGKKTWRFNTWLEGVRKDIGRYFRL